VSSLTKASAGSVVLTLVLTLSETSIRDGGAGTGRRSLSGIYLERERLVGTQYFKRKRRRAEEVEEREKARDRKREREKERERARERERERERESERERERERESKRKREGNKDIY
jgi:membrane protein involved in colicin uptake